MSKVICFGEVLWDCFGSLKKAGGAPMNVALHLHRQGIESTFISAIGNDEDGKELCDFLQGEGLDPRLVQTHGELPTGIVQVHLDEQQQATYTIVKPVAWDAIGYTDELGDLVKNADALVFGSLACRSEQSRDTLLRLLSQAKLKIFDMNLRPPHFTTEVLARLMQLTDILKINEHELAHLAELYQLKGANEEELLADLSRKFNFQAICLTLGEKGAMVWKSGKVYKHKGYPVKVADTVGAGDAFLASFIGGLLKQQPMEKILAEACATGALIASRPGANPDYTAADIQEILNTTP